jgi:hypothetical protein
MKHHDEFSSPISIKKITKRTPTHRILVDVKAPPPPPPP